MADWFTLDPAKARYGATEGAWINGIAALVMPSRDVVLCGHMSCDSKLSAERHALTCDSRDGDKGRLTRAQLEAMR